MKHTFFLLILCILPIYLIAQPTKVKIIQTKDGFKLQLNSSDFIINGMNWDYFPIGTNYTYSLWKQPDPIIKEALDNEMSLLKTMGVNTIRQYSDVPPKWISYIYKNYGIYTMLNHAFGRYGVEVNGVLHSHTDYGNPQVKQLLIKEVTLLAKKYKNTPGLLLYLLGNENNYGLFWEGSETEDIPSDVSKKNEEAKALYKLFNEATLAIKSADKNHPVAICNGDLQFLDIIKAECNAPDIFGANIYRGQSFGDAFERVKNELNKPLLITEFGADAFNAITQVEDQTTQAIYNVANWKEIYANAAGMGNAGNAIGGFTFQFTDGWWKFGQTTNLDKHDANASWSNGGYKDDYVINKNNMNEEWFGICAKGETDGKGIYKIYPRAAYYALKEAHQFNPYSKGACLKELADHFARIP